MACKTDILHFGHVSRFVASGPRALSLFSLAHIPCLSRQTLITLNCTSRSLDPVSLSCFRYRLVLNALNALSTHQPTPIQCGGVNGTTGGPQSKPQSLLPRLWHRSSRWRLRLHPTTPSKFRHSLECLAVETWWSLHVDQTPFVTSSLLVWSVPVSTIARGAAMGSHRSPHRARLRCTKSPFPPPR